MRRLPSAQRRLGYDERGATLVEFAIVVGPMMLMTLGILDFAHRNYLAAVAQDALYQAAREATLGNLSAAELDTLVINKMKVITNSRNVSIEKKTYYEFSGVGKPEKITQDTAPFSQYNVGDCYEDANGNSTYDTVGGKNGIGSGDDVLYYKVTVTYPQILPMAGLMGWGTTNTLKASTVMRNQPYTAQTAPTVRCN